MYVFDIGHDKGIEDRCFNGPAINLSFDVSTAQLFGSSTEYSLLNVPNVVDSLVNHFDPPLTVFRYVTLGSLTTLSRRSSTLSHALTPNPAQLGFDHLLAPTHGHEKRLDFLVDTLPAVVRHALQTRGGVQLAARGEDLGKYG